MEAKVLSCSGLLLIFDSLINYLSPSKTHRPVFYIQIIPSLMGNATNLVVEKLKNTNPSLAPITTTHFWYTETGDGRVWGMGLKIDC